MRRIIWPRGDDYKAAFAAAVVSTMAAILIVTGTTALFQSRGAPLQQLATAERACAGEEYASDRALCIERWIAARQERHSAER